METYEIRVRYEDVYLVQAESPEEALEDVWSGNLEVDYIDSSFDTKYEKVLTSNK